MQLGLVGLGKMGFNMRERLRQRRPRGGRLRPEPGVTDASSLADLVEKLDRRRGRSGSWCRPATRPGRPSTNWPSCSSEGDLVIDGGNSRFTDDKANATFLDEKGIGYLDCGVSGGVWGLDVGYGLMVGGPTRTGRARDADLRRAAPGGPARGGLRARRRGRRWPLREDGAQRHRVRPDAGLRRGLRAADRRGQVTDVPAMLKAWTSGHGGPVLAARPAGPRAGRRTRTWPRSAATPRTPARAGGPSRRRSTTRCRCR